MKKIYVIQFLIILLGISNSIAMELPVLFHEKLARQEASEPEEGWDGELLSPSAHSIEKKYSELVALYKQYEMALHNETILQKINKESLISICGDINYQMTLEEMKQKIKEKFNTMKKNGLIVSKSEFEKIKHHYFSKSSSDLSRIWGAEYLKNKISESQNLQNKYDVPSYVIVTDDPTRLTVKVHFGHDIFPIPTGLENATIYFQNIDGTPVAQYSAARFDLGVNSGIGYTDFSDNGNIIRCSGKEYIVDTEYKSFSLSISLLKMKKLMNYAAQKFRYLNNDIFNYVYDIDLGS